MFAVGQEYKTVSWTQEYVCFKEGRHKVDQQLALKKNITFFLNVPFHWMIHILVLKTLFGFTLKAGRASPARQPCTGSSPGPRLPLFKWVSLQDGHQTEDNTFVFVFLQSRYISTNTQRKYYYLPHMYILKNNIYCINIRTLTEANNSLTQQSKLFSFFCFTFHFLSICIYDIYKE